MLRKACDTPLSFTQVRNNSFESEGADGESKGLFSDTYLGEPNKTMSLIQHARVCVLLFLFCVVPGHGQWRTYRGHIFVPQGAAQ